MRKLLMLSAIAAFVCLPAVAVAQWSDNFDSYATDSSLHGQGGWKGWDNDPTWTAYTRDEYALSAPNSVEIAGNSDLVQEYGYAGGQWTYTAMQYIPDNFVGQSWFIIQNTYNDGGPYDWSVQTSFDTATGMVQDVYTGNTMPIIYEQWVELRVEIDLDTDYREFYYNGALLGAYTWTTGASSLLEIGSVDLYANGATAIYYDDMSLVPEPATALLVVIGAALLRRR